MNSQVDSSENAERVSDEVEALKAIFGTEAVSHDDARGTLSVTLPNAASLSMLLPPAYPGQSRPLSVTLRSSGLVRAQAEEVVRVALESVHDEHPNFAECVYDYCVAIGEEMERERPDEDGDAVEGESSRIAPSDTALFQNCSIVHGEPLVDRKSVFQAHGARVSSVEEAQGFVAHLLNEFPKLRAASHNVMAYKVRGAQDCDDDGEHAAGKGLLFTLQQLDVDNVVVVVSRHFGGTKLGPVRFKHINNVARSLMVDQGFV